MGQCYAFAPSAPCSRDHWLNTSPQWTTMHLAPPCRRARLIHSAAATEIQTDSSPFWYPNKSSSKMYSIDCLFNKVWTSGLYQLYQFSQLTEVILLCVAYSTQHIPIKLEKASSHVEGLLSRKTITPQIMRLLTLGLSLKCLESTLLLLVKNSLCSCITHCLRWWNSKAG